LIDFGHRSRLGVEPGIGIAQYIQQSHKYLQIEIIRCRI
jgi:hypothetical protein